MKADQNRAIVIVLDGCGAGATPDAGEYGDPDTVATLLNVWNEVGGFQAPNLQDCGFLMACGLPVHPVGIDGKEVEYGRLQPVSKGKDSVTGHWEMMGAMVDKPCPTYPDGFPKTLVEDFEEHIGTEVIGNIASSGTEIIANLGQEHMETRKPILYTSADSVFQIACHEEIYPPERLYEFCMAARQILVDPHNVQRVIARPFVGSPGSGFVRTSNRKDFPLSAPPNLLDKIDSTLGIGVVPELFAGRGFAPNKRTQSNPEHEVALVAALESDHRFIFANFEDFDMLYGHRNDPAGFAKCLEQFDEFLGRLIPMLQEGDLLILSADHGNDPTNLESTDHTREFVPFVALRSGNGSVAMPDRKGLDHVGQAVAQHLGIKFKARHSED